jgi:hypothetical protein
MQNYFEEEQLFRHPTDCSESTHLVDGRQVSRQLEEEQTVVQKTFLQRKVWRHMWQQLVSMVFLCRRFF